MSKINNRGIGNLGEEFAAKLLTLKDYKVLERNFRFNRGEIDIIAEKDDELFFIEIKTRQSEEFGLPAEAVTREKQIRIRNTARYYLLNNHGRYKAYSFQVIEVMVNQIKNAF
ncbi:MAG: YraN family protein [Eubacteriales bacterium]|nr:YraN family protein [Eubacteriales bacterium]